MKLGKVIGGFAMTIGAAWFVSGGLGFLFWLGDGYPMESSMPEIIYFGGAPIITLIGLVIAVWGLMIFVGGLTGE